MAPIGKHKLRRRVDATPQQPFAVAAGDSGSVPQAWLPAPPMIAPPVSLALSTALSHSAVTPSARITASWQGLESYDLEKYAVQFSTSSTFIDTATQTYRTPINTPTITIDGLPLSTTYYVRVAVIVGDTQGDWSGSANITTPATDTVAPGVPTGVTAAFVNAGDLLITWANPTSANFRDVEVSVYESASKVTLYWRVYTAAGRAIFTAAMNGQATSYAYDPSLYVELRSRNWTEVYSAVVSVSATLARPATPAGLTSSWAGDTGTAGPDCTVRWTALAYYRYWLTIDSTARALGFADQFTETLDANRADHSGTPDPVLSLSLVAVDALGQTSATPATATATNATPPAPTATLTQGAVSGLYATVTSAPAADFWRYEYVFKRDGTTVATILSAASTVRYEMQGAGDDGYHSWSVVIRQEDLFAQFSATVTPAAVAFEALTLAGLRAMAAYSDSIGSSAVALAALKDGDTGAGGVVYSA